MPTINQLNAYLVAQGSIEAAKVRYILQQRGGNLAHLRPKPTRFAQGLQPDHRSEISCHRVGEGH
jgi:hypothetical protein